MIRCPLSGIIGAFVGGFLFSRLRISLGIENGIVVQIIHATVGAVIVVLGDSVRDRDRDSMEGVGWIAAIIIGGFAGWLAGKLMDARYGILLNIVLGIVGSVVATAILAQFHLEVAGGRLDYFITGFLGACLLIFVARLARR